MKTNFNDVEESKGDNLNESFHFVELQRKISELENNVFNLQHRIDYFIQNEPENPFIFHNQSEEESIKSNYKDEAFKNRFENMKKDTKSLKKFANNIQSQHISEQLSEHDSLIHQLLDDVSH